MAYEADRVVVELLAQNEQFDAANKSSAANFQRDMSGIVSSGAKAEAGVARFSGALKENRLAMNQSRIGMMEFQHVARGVTDQMAVGAPVTTILTSHLGELSEAVVLSGSAFGKLGAFLQGPWGIALTLSTVVVAKLITTLLNQKGAVGELVDKLKEHHEKTLLNDEAQRVYDHTVEGSIDAMAKLTAELDKQNLTLEDNINLKKVAIAGTISDVVGNIGSVSTQLAQAAEEYRAAQRAFAEIEGGNLPLGENSAAALSGAQSRIDTARQRVVDLSAQLGALNKAAESGARALRSVDFSLLERGAKEATNPIAAINRKYDDMATSAERAATGNDRLKASLKGTLDQIERNRAADLKAAQANGAGEFGRQVSFADAAAIARGAGLSVTSGYRSTAHQAELFNDPAYNRPGNPVARPGTSAHEGVNGKWALDIAFAPGITAQSLKKLYGDQGVTLSAVYKESGHFHIEGSRSQAAAAENKAAREAEAAAKKAAEQRAVFQQAQDGLDSELIAVRKSEVKGALEQLDIREEEVRAEQKKRDDGYASAVTTGKLTQAQADQLTAAEATVAAEKIRALEIQRQVLLIQQQDDAAERAAQFQEDNLRAAEQGATSQAQRRELDLQILDILYAERLAHLERLKLIAEDNRDQRAANDAQAQIDQLPAQKANDRAGLLRQTMDPLEAWLHAIPHDAHAVTEALQGIATNGFDQIASSIAGVVTGTQSLGQAFSSISKQIVGDIIQMTIRMLIFRALSGFLGGGAGIPGFSSGSQLPVDSFGSASLFQGSSFGGARAGGGPVSGGRAYVVGEHGPELFVPGSSGAIVPSNARAASPWGGGNGMVVVHIEASEYFDGRVVQVMGPVVAQTSVRAAQGGAGLARQSLARSALHRLG